MDGNTRFLAKRVPAGLMIAAALALTGCQAPNSLLRQQGINALDTNDVAQADNRFALAVKQDPTDWKAMYLLGKVRIMEGQPLEAQLLEEKAVTLRPHEAETPDILDAEAEAIFLENQPAALAAMLQTAADDYGTVRDFLRQGKYLGKIGDVDGAKLAYRKAVRLAPANDPEPFIEMADYLESVGDTQGAIKALRNAYFIMPRSERLAERFRRYGIVPWADGNADAGEVTPFGSAHGFWRPFLSGTASAACTHAQLAVSWTLEDTADSAIRIAPLAVPLGIADIDRLP